MGGTALTGRCCNNIELHTSSRKQEFPTQCWVGTHVGTSKPWVPFSILVRANPELGLISTSIGATKIKCYFF